jgi:hypothetical protein
MALQLSVSNILQLFGIFSPIFLAFFLVLISIFNQNIKGLIYLGGVAIASILNIFIQTGLKDYLPISDSVFCNLYNVSSLNPARFNSMFIAFTFMYLLLPMLSNNQVNVWLIGLLVAMFAVDAYTNVSNGCTNVKIGVVFNGVIGLIFGLIFYSIMMLTGNESLLYFQDLTSNNVVCKRPNNQTFKCSVYKNGQLLGDI